MKLEPLCEGAKVLGHSGPTLHWWLSLTAADQGAWVAGLGAFAAAFVAVVLSRKEERRRDGQHALRGRLTAAYLYVPFRRIQNFVSAISTHATNVASVLPGEASKNILADVQMLEIACAKIRPLRERFSLTEAAYLELQIATALAMVVSEIDQLMDVIAATATAFHAADRTDNPDQTRFKAGQQFASVPRRLPAINEKIEIFLSYCKKMRIPVTSN